MRKADWRKQLLCAQSDDSCRPIFSKPDTMPVKLLVFNDLG